MSWWVEPKRDEQRPIEEPKAAMCRPLKASCTVPTVERSGKSWIDCVLPASERVCADLRAQRRLDQVQKLLLCGLLEGPHIWAPLARWSIRQICFATNVEHVEADLVFVEPRYEVLDLGHECWALGGHLAQGPYYRHILLEELDRATAQGFDTPRCGRAGSSGDATKSCHSAPSRLETLHVRE
jgi:hypothetical protein